MYVVLVSVLVCISLFHNVLNSMGWCVWCVCWCLLVCLHRGHTSTHSGSIQPPPICHRDHQVEDYFLTRTQREGVTHMDGTVLYQETSS